MLGFSRYLCKKQIGSGWQNGFPYDGRTHKRRIHSLQVNGTVGACLGFKSAVSTLVRSSFHAVEEKSLSREL